MDPTKTAALLVKKSHHEDTKSCDNKFEGHKSISSSLSSSSSSSSSISSSDHVILSRMSSTFPSTEPGKRRKRRILRGNVDEGEDPPVSCRCQSQPMSKILPPETTASYSSKDSESQTTRLTMAVPENLVSSNKILTTFGASQVEPSTRLHRKSACTEQTLLPPRRHISTTNHSQQRPQEQDIQLKQQRTKHNMTILDVSSDESDWRAKEEELLLVGVPRPWRFGNNHVLVNRERVKRGLPQLQRSVRLDALAQKTASYLTTTNKITINSQYPGNVVRGTSVKHIHEQLMKRNGSQQLANILNPSFQAFGMGTAKGKDGSLYLCQFFALLPL